MILSQLGDASVWTPLGKRVLAEVLADYTSRHHPGLSGVATAPVDSLHFVRLHRPEKPKSGAKIRMGPKSKRNRRSATMCRTEPGSKPCLASLDPSPDVSAQASATGLSFLRFEDSILSPPWRAFQQSSRTSPKRCKGFSSGIRWFRECRQVYSPTQ